MSKKYLLALILGFAMTTSTVLAEIQSPIYTDDIGRSHFLGRGGYSTVRQLQMQETQANFVNDAVNKYSSQKDTALNKSQNIEKTTEATNENLQNADIDITKVINEKAEKPVARQKATFSSEKRNLDPSAPYGYGNTYLPSGVNESKTLYTDELGRLHFFGKANKITETSVEK